MAHEHLLLCDTWKTRTWGHVWGGKGSAWVSFGRARRSEGQNSYGVAAFTGTGFPSVAPHKEGSLQSPLEGPLSPREWQEVRDAGVQLGPSKNRLCAPHRCLALCCPVCDMNIWTPSPSPNRDQVLELSCVRVCPNPLLLCRPHLLPRENWWVLVRAPSSSRRCRDTWALIQASLGSGGAMRVWRWEKGRGGEGKGY